MVGELIMLPVRVGVRATQLWLRAAEGTVSVAVNAAGRLAGVASSGSPGGPVSDEARRPSERDVSGEAEPITQSAASVSAPDAEPKWPADRTWPTDQPSPGPASPSETRLRSAGSALEAEPAHVSEEPELVEEFAEPGAEDGAGAEIRIETPWDGYDQMNAKQVISRLASAPPAELAAVQLYESMNRHRQTILNAVQREMRSSNGRNSL